jgi:hypothetical protein
VGKVIAETKSSQQRYADIQEISSKRSSWGFGKKEEKKKKRKLMILIEEK